MKIKYQFIHVVVLKLFRLNLKQIFKSSAPSNHQQCNSRNRSSETAVLHILIHCPELLCISLIIIKIIIIMICTYHTLTLNLHEPGNPIDKSLSF